MNQRHHLASKMVVFMLISASLLSAKTLAWQKTERQRWEYCAITFWNSYFTASENKTTGIAGLCYLQSTGCQNEQIRFEVDVAEVKKSFEPRLQNDDNVMSNALALASQGALAKTMARLGEEGWEMVGEGVFSKGAERSNNAIYFKRRK